MFNPLDSISSRFRSRDKPSGINDTPLDKNKHEALKKKAKELEATFLGSKGTSEKLAQQEAMSFMRRERERERSMVDVTYPISPPFSFVNIVFDRKVGEYRYNVKEPRLSDQDQATLKLVREKIEATMDQDQMPQIEGNMFNRSSRFSDYLRQRFDRVTYLFDIKIDKRKKPVITYYLERESWGLE